MYEGSLIGELERARGAAEEVRNLQRSLDAAMRDRQRADVAIGEIVKRGDVDSLNAVLARCGLKHRTVPLNDVARTVLTDLKKQSNGSATVFVCDKTGKAPLDIKTGFARAREDSKIEGFRFHDLRHTFATRLADR